MERTSQVVSALLLRTLFDGADPPVSWRSQRKQRNLLVNEIWSRSSSITIQATSGLQNNA